VSSRHYNGWARIGKVLGVAAQTAGTENAVNRTISVWMICNMFDVLYKARG